MGGTRLVATFRAGAVAAACVAVLLLGGAGRALAAGPCSGSAMYTAAHEDDTLLFQSPRLLEDVRANKCVLTVFLTAGDAGKGAKYWEGRETGAEAGYAEMAGVANDWSGSTLSAGGHSIHLETLKGQPGVSIAYLRLPDGGVNGEGFPLYGNQSLKKLWNSGNGNVPPSLASLKTVDETDTYSYSGLIATLTALIESFGPREIVTQNYEQMSLVGADHSDHVATGKFTQLAQSGYAAGHLFIGYQGYEVLAEPANVSGPLLAAKEAAFFAYTPFDEACGVDEDCEGPPYTEWLPRQWPLKVKPESTPGAVAGPAQAILPGAVGKLNGSGSFDPGGAPLQYEWTQTGGPKVTLSDPAATSPSFASPPTPTTLTFSLTVSNGTKSSLPSTVTVTVANPPPPPQPGPVPGPSGPSGPPAPVVVKLSRHKVQLPLGKKSKFLVQVTAPSDASVSCRGGLPKGARCRVTAGRNVVVEGSKSVRKAGIFQLTVHVVGAEADATRRLTVVFARQNRR
jgi:GlcNAc-PI de-N-acetylase